MEKMVKTKVKTKIEVFGIHDECSVGTCSCGGACGSSNTEKTMGELFKDLVSFFDESGFGDQVELNFFDVFEDDLSNHDNAHTMYKMGFALPLVVINGKVSCYGGISNQFLLKQVINFKDR